MRKFKNVFLMSLLMLLARPVIAAPLDDMVSPITNPVNFEDPRSQSEARLIYIYHKISDDFITEGGDVRIYALQLRYAIDDRLALLATKDGWVDMNPDAALTDEEGFGNVAVGAKYAFYKDSDAGQILTTGLRYEIPMGNTDVLQGQGDGSFNPFLSGATTLGPINLMVGTGFRLPVSDEDSSFYDMDLHLDTKIGWFYPTFEVNLVHVLDGGERLPIADEGEDYFNFGATEATGKTLVTAAVGARARVSEQVDLGLAYQFPLTQGQGSNLIDWRITTDLIYHF